jgi:hypothetical protein
MLSEEIEQQGRSAERAAPAQLSTALRVGTALRMWTAALSQLPARDPKPDAYAAFAWEFDPQARASNLQRWASTFRGSFEPNL